MRADHEVRSAQPLEVRGRRISGVALPWGARARVEVRGEVVEETFVQGAFEDLRPVPLVLEHRGPVIGQVTPTSTSRGLEVEGDYSGDLGGRDRFSIEFLATRETRSHDLRIVSAATLGRLAAVKRPAYDSAVIEHRERGGFKARIDPGGNADCRCAGRDSGVKGVDSIGFEEGAFEDHVLEVAAGRRNVSAISRGAGDVIADTRTGSLRLSASRGGLAIDIDALDTEAGRRTSELVVAGVGVAVRPIIDFKRSKYRAAGNLALVSAAVFSYILVKPTDRLEGVSELESAPEGRGKGPVEGERRSQAILAHSAVRRIWL